MIEREDFMDELASIRNIYKKAFRDLIVKTAVSLDSEKPKLIACDSLSPNTPIQISTTSQLSLDSLRIVPLSLESRFSSSPDLKTFSSTYADIQPSRFRDEYRAIRKLGRGGKK